MNICIGFLKLVSFFDEAAGGNYDAGRAGQ